MPVSGGKDLDKREFEIPEIIGIRCGRLNTYLADINEKATEHMLLLVKQMAEREGVTEELKAQDQMFWVQRMNNSRDRATELVNHELIYV